MEDLTVACVICVARGRGDQEVAKLEMASFRDRLAMCSRDLKWAIFLLENIVFQLIKWHIIDAFTDKPTSKAH